MPCRIVAIYCTFTCNADDKWSFPGGWNFDEKAVVINFSVTILCEGNFRTADILHAPYIVADTVETQFAWIAEAPEIDFVVLASCITPAVFRMPHG